MCSFIFLRTRTSIANDSLNLANIFAKQRGPNHTNIVRETDESGYALTYVHNLLDISGSARLQPILGTPANPSLRLLFNGEIYNYRELGSHSADTDVLLPLFVEAKDDYAHQLDGEFAILIHDTENSRLHLATDPFLTKPLYIGYTDDPNEIGVASYRSSLEATGFVRIEMATPNSRYSIQFGKRAGILKEQIVCFETQQHTSHYDEWCECFEASVRKRLLHGSHPPFVALSSGYDSAAICTAINKLNRGYTTITIAHGESESLLKSRTEVNARNGGRAVTIPFISQEESTVISEEIRTNVEPLTYFHQDTPNTVKNLYEDSGAVGAYKVAEVASLSGIHVCLSGAGADEVTSDYGFGGTKHYHHSQFGGLFPKDLSKIFPWKKFYGDTQRSYLFKDEYIFGRFGIEGRYPFLDRRLVQAFLSLTPELKNLKYKAPIHYYLTANSYPFEEGVKRGFVPIREVAVAPPESTPRLTRMIRRLKRWS